MAFEIGVASDHVDLWDKLLAFLTTNPDLVATGQNWSIGWQTPYRSTGYAISSALHSSVAAGDLFFSGDISNKWVIGNTGVWVGFEFKEPVSVNHVTLMNQTSQPNGWPTNISVQRRNGTDWVTEWTTNTGFTSGSGQVVELTDPDYVVDGANPVATGWRILVNSNAGDVNTCINRIVFRGSPGGEQLSVSLVPGTNETDCVVVGPGTGGMDQIYVGLRRVDNPATDHYTLWMNGMTGLLTGATQITEHVNVSERVAVYLDSAPMNYWFVANGRRFAVVIKIATIYEALYGGLFLPYADPLQYSYPLFIGGSVKQTRGDDLNINWGDTDDSHRNYTLSTGNPYSSRSYDHPSTAYMLSPGAEWKHVSYSAGAGSAFLRPFHPAGGLDTHTSASGGAGLSSMLSKTRECLGGGFSLEPATLVSDNPVDQTYGTLDGVYHTPSETNYSENLITVGGVDHLVFQNIWRTDNIHLAAMALE